MFWFGGEIQAASLDLYVEPGTFISEGFAVFRSIGENIFQVVSVCGFLSHIYEAKCPEFPKLDPKERKRSQEQSCSGIISVDILMSVRTQCTFMIRFMANVYAN